MREGLVDVGDTKLYLREWGGEGPPILFWHALGDHTSMQMVEAGPVLVSEFGYRVVGVDAPGFGGSPRLPDDRYEIPALIQLAHDLLDALGYERPAWSGSSWGAIVGLGTSRPAIRSAWAPSRSWTAATCTRPRARRSTS